MIPTFRWEAPGPYEVAFSTRLGGVSEGAFESLNLGILTGDEPERVIENRTRLCEKVGIEPGLATMLWQQHGPGVVRASIDRGVLTAGFDHPPGDVLWSDEPGLAMMLITADCLPVAVARANGSAPAIAVLHVGWRGLLAGIAAAATEALGGGRLAAVIGPGIGPCCYEVGEDVAEPFRRRFGAEVLVGSHLDLYAATEKALHGAGCTRVERVEMCTSCHPDLFFSHRRDDGVTGRQGVVARVA
ncbi:MAG TPA: polyphenol oxidase family protein [Gaiellaceae bacterium]|nr:polyphenol oxidase family protein [Gaiellaceae bacterium]